MADLELHLAATDEAPHHAREEIRAQLADRIPATTLYDLLTIVSELVANGVIHGSGDTVEVRISVNGDGLLHGEVSNEGEGEIQPQPVDVHGGSGLGLRIVDAIAERWHAVGDGPTRVEFELRTP